MVIEVTKWMELRLIQSFTIRSDNAARGKSDFVKVVQFVDNIITMDTSRLLLTTGGGKMDCTGKFVVHEISYLTPSMPHINEKGAPSSPLLICLQLPDLMKMVPPSCDSNTVSDNNIIVSL